MRLVSLGSIVATRTVIASTERGNLVFIEYIIEFKSYIGIQAEIPMVEPRFDRSILKEEFKPKNC